MTERLEIAEHVPQSVTSGYRLSKRVPYNYFDEFPNTLQFIAAKAFCLHLLSKPDGAKLFKETVYEKVEDGSGSNARIYTREVIPVYHIQEAFLKLNPIKIPTQCLFNYQKVMRSYKNYQKRKLAQLKMSKPLSDFKRARFNRIVRWLIRELRISDKFIFQLQILRHFFTKKSFFQGKKLILSGSFRQYCNDPDGLVKQNHLNFRFTPVKFDPKISYSYRKVIVTCV